MYKEAKEVARQFKKEFNDLLKRHKATMAVEDLPTKHECSVPEKTIRVYIPADYGADGKCLAEWAEIELGNYLDGN